MKKLGLVLAVIGMIGNLIGAEAKTLRIPLGSLTVEEVAFKIDNISISSPDVVRVEIISENGRQIRISGLKVGITDVQLLGGGMSQVYKVTVNDDLREKLNSLKRDLDAVPELDISMNNGKLVLKGELSSIANQELKNKVVKAYGNYILDLSTFRPTPEVMLGLQKNFEKAGFKVVRNTNNANPGEISITQVGEMLTIAGSVYGTEDLKKINSILVAQPWLTVNANNAAADKNKVQAYVNVQVLPIMLQVDVVHIAIDKTDAEKIGINWSEFVDGGFQATVNTFWQAVNNRNASTTQDGSGSIRIGSNGPLNAVLAFLGSNGINRTRRAGFLTFKSNDTPEFRKMHSGGTLYISSGANPGGSTQLQDIDYGLILQVKGGLTGQNDVSLELKQELSYPGPKGLYAQAAEIDVKKFTTTTSISCKLGETVAIAGLKEFLQDSTDSASIPYLRNVPGLKWLLAENETTFTESQVLTLICVRPMSKSDGIDPVSVELNKMKRAEDQALRDRDADLHKNDGKWYEFWRW